MLQEFKNRVENGFENHAYFVYDNYKKIIPAIALTIILLVVNSISKRSSAPGLRSGFIAGDSKILKEYLKYRTYVGVAVPLPLQMASAVAWSDEEHVLFARKQYTKNLQLAKEILGVDIPKTTFYIWLEVDDEIEFTKTLYKKYNLKVLPGSFLGRNGIGKNYIRLALVYDTNKTKDALIRISHVNYPTAKQV